LFENSSKAENSLKDNVPSSLDCRSVAIGPERDSPADVDLQGSSLISSICEKRTDYLESSGIPHNMISEGIIEGHMDLGFTEHSKKVGVLIAEVHSKEVCKERYFQEGSSWLHSTALKRSVMDLSATNEKFRRVVEGHILPRTWNELSNSRKLLYTV
jgi:hypothetical protein